jgi:hypothetical protein
MFILATVFYASGASVNLESSTDAAPTTIIHAAAPSVVLVRAAVARRFPARPSVGPGNRMPILLTYSQAKAAGYPVPELDPDLPICPPGLGPGFSTSVIDDAAGDPNGPTICQLDLRKAVITIGGPDNEPR